MTRTGAEHRRHQSPVSRRPSLDSNAPTRGPRRRAYYGTSPLRAGVISRPTRPRPAWSRRVRVAYVVSKVPPRPAHPSSSAGPGDSAPCNRPLPPGTRTGSRRRRSHPAAGSSAATTRRGRQSAALHRHLRREQGPPWSACPTSWARHPPTRRPPSAVRASAPSGEPTSTAPPWRPGSSAARIRRGQPGRAALHRHLRREQGTRPGQRARRPGPDTRQRGDRHQRCGPQPPPGSRRVQRHRGGRARQPPGHRRGQPGRAALHRHLRREQGTRPGQRARRPGPDTRQRGDRHQRCGPQPFRGADEYSATVAAGLVSRRDPAAASQVAPLSTVTYVVSKGPAPVSVPDVLGTDTRQRGDRHQRCGPQPPPGSRRVQRHRGGRARQPPGPPRPARSRRSPPSPTS